MNQEQYLEFLKKHKITKTQIHKRGGWGSSFHCNVTHKYRTAQECVALVVAFEKHGINLHDLLDDIKKSREENLYIQVNYKNEAFKHPDDA